MFQRHLRSYLARISEVPFTPPQPIPSSFPVYLGKWTRFPVLGRGEAEGLSGEPEPTGHCSPAGMEEGREGSHRKPSFFSPCLEAAFYSGVSSGRLCL